MTPEEERERAAGMAAFAEYANEKIAGLVREGDEDLSRFHPVDGVTVPPRVWAAVRQEIGSERLVTLLERDHAALHTLLRETWRAQRVAEEHRG